MKKIAAIIFTGVVLNSGFCQTATDFTANDCTGTPHTLFTELDAGKVVILCWVMPCPTCIDGSAMISSTVAEIANPNVVFYLVDDYGNTTCSELETWTGDNGVSPTAIFDNTGDVIQMDDYGIPSMFKAVVLGGTDHHIFLTQDDGIFEGNELEDSIYSALGILSVDENTDLSAIRMYPNPANSRVQLNYFLSGPEVVSVSVLSLSGELVAAVDVGEQSSGNQSYTLSLEKINGGLYFVKLNAGAYSKTIKLKVIE